MKCARDRVRSTLRIHAGAMALTAFESNQAYTIERQRPRAGDDFAQQRGLIETTFLFAIGV